MVTDETAYCVRCGAAIFRWHEGLLSRHEGTPQPALPLELIRVKNWCAEFRVICSACRGRCLVKIDLPSNTYTLGTEDADVMLIPMALRQGYAP